MGTRVAFRAPYLAETEGFEPSEPFTARLVSSEVLSTTQPRLLRFLRYHKQALWARFCAVFMVS